MISFSVGLERGQRGRDPWERNALFLFAFIWISILVGRGVLIKCLVGTFLPKLSDPFLPWISSVFNFSPYRNSVILSTSAGTPTQHHKQTSSSPRLPETGSRSARAALGQDRGQRSPREPCSFRTTDSAHIFLCTPNPSVELHPWTTD